jgi:hypothetical protein
VSTKSRKERKRAGIPLLRVAKEGTPVDERAENKRHAIRPLGSLVPRRFGLTSRVVARLRAYGFDAEKETKP